MRPDLAAAFRLMTTLPVRTHERCEMARQGVKSTNVAMRKRRALEMQLAGVSRADIIERSGLSRRTLEELLGWKRISTARKARKE